MSLSPTKLNLRYNIGFEILGTGGFGKVTLGQDLVTGSPVAVKTVSKRVFDRREVDMLKALNIPHTIKYRHDFAVEDAAKPEDAQHRIVMDLVNGKDIFETYYTTTCEPMSLPEIRSLAYQLFEFLEALRARQIVYRDLKPENMIWQKPCRNLTVVDLGTAYQLGSSAIVKMGGTVHYAPPECLLGKPLDQSYDLWSVATTLFVLICSEFLFDPNLKLPDIEQLQYIVQQMEEQVGPPTDEYLQNCQRAKIFYDQNHMLRQTWPQATNRHWPERLLAGLERLGASEEEKAQWLDLMTTLLRYENRGTPSEHMNRPLFQSEVQVYLDYDPQCRCKMYIQRLELINKPFEDITYDDLKEVDYKANFRIDKNCCIHLPQSTTNEYVIFLELNDQVIAGTVQLRRGDTLTIRNFQKELVPAKTALFLDEAEPDLKKSKSDVDE